MLHKHFFKTYIFPTFSNNVIYFTSNLTSLNTNHSWVYLTGSILLDKLYQTYSKIPKYALIYIIARSINRSYETIITVSVIEKPTHQQIPRISLFIIIQSNPLFASGSRTHRKFDEIEGAFTGLMKVRLPRNRKRIRNIISDYRRHVGNLDYNFGLSVCSLEHWKKRVLWRTL